LRTSLKAIAGSASCVATVAFFVVGVAACGPHHAADDERTVAPPAAWSYTVTADADLTTLDVKACVGTPRAKRLMPGREAARAYLLAAPRPDGAGCFVYRVDLVALVSDAGAARRAYASSDVRIITTGDWLWRPRRVPKDTEATITFALPDGIQVTTPWPADGNTTASFRLNHGAFQWKNQVALGRFETAAFSVAGGNIDVVFLDGAKSVDNAAITSWLSRVSETVSDFYGRFPARHATVFVIPVGPGVDPVHFGYVLRGGGPSITLLLNTEANRDDLEGDWVALHEMFHLGMPPIEASAPWLYEGVTMYYTEVLRARGGFVSPATAWQKLHEGFERGVANSNANASLGAASAAMHSSKRYRWVYWGGAAIAFEADLRLRRTSGGARSLDTQMRYMFEASYDAHHRTWAADEIIALLDASDPTDTFGTVSQRTLRQSGFPDITPIYRWLGLNASADSLSLLKTPEAVAMRRAILTGKAVKTRSSDDF
jgi:hypothetical protein